MYKVNPHNHSELVPVGVFSFIAKLPFSWRFFQWHMYKKLVKVYGKQCVRIVDNAIKIDLPA
jgi:hypothetical protein